MVPAPEGVTADIFPVVPIVTVGGSIIFSLATIVNVTTSPTFALLLLYVLLLANVAVVIVGTVLSNVT